MFLGIAHSNPQARRRETGKQTSCPVLVRTICILGMLAVLANIACAPVVIARTFDSTADVGTTDERRGNDHNQYSRLNFSNTVEDAPVLTAEESDPGLRPVIPTDDPQGLRPVIPTTTEPQLPRESMKERKQREKQEKQGKKTKAKKAKAKEEKAKEEKEVKAREASDKSEGKDRSGAANEKNGKGLKFWRKDKKDAAVGLPKGEGKPTKKEDFIQKKNEKEDKQDTKDTRDKKDPKDKKGKHDKKDKKDKLDKQSKRDEQNKVQDKRKNNSAGLTETQPRSKSPSDVQISQRARTALDDFYDGNPPTVEQYLVDLKSNDRPRIQESLLFLEAFLHQALDDEANSASGKQSTSKPNRSAGAAMSARGHIHSAIFKTGVALPAVRLVPVLADDMLPTADGAAAFIIGQVSGPDVVPVYTKLLARPHSSSLLIAAVLRKIARDNQQQFGPSIKDLTRHYRGSVRQAALEAASALRLQGVPQFDEALSVTPWLASQISQISRLKDGQDKLFDVKAQPAANPVVNAAVDYVKGDRKGALHAIIEKINALPDDRLLFLQTRDEVFLQYYRLALREFVAGNYRNTAAICNYLSGPAFMGMPLSGDAKALQAQLSDRSGDQKTIVLPDEKSWLEMQKKLSLSEQFEYLGVRLRLLKGGVESRNYLLGARPVNMDAQQSNVVGQPVINPLSQLRRLIKDPSNIPLLFPHIGDKHFTLTIIETTPGAFPKLRTVGNLVSELINESLQFEMIPSNFSSLNGKQQKEYLGKQEKWCRQNARARGKDLNYAVASTTNDARTFALQTHRLAEARDSRLGALLSKRYGNFPDDIAREAELMAQIGGPDAVKRAEAVVKQPPPVVRMQSTDSGVVRNSKLRPEVARFWFTVLLLREKNKEGLAESKRMAALQVGAMPSAVRINLPVLVEGLLNYKTPEAETLAGTFVDKFAEKLTPEAFQVLDAGKIMFVYATNGSYERLLRWMETEPVSPGVLSRMEEWLGLRTAASPYNPDVKTRISEIRNKLQEEFASLKAGKPSRLKPQ